MSLPTGLQQFIWRCFNQSLDNVSLPVVCGNTFSGDLLRVPCMVLMPVHSIGMRAGKFATAWGTVGVPSRDAA